MKRNAKKNKGITLISLVITIIVLLILAGVTIASLSGDNGILERSKEAKINTEIAEIKEKVELIKEEMIIKKESEEKIVFNGKKLLNYINSKIEGSRLEGKRVITSDEKYAIRILDNQGKNIKVEKYEGKLKDGELGVDLYFDEELNSIIVYPMIGGIESYEQFVQKRLNKMTYDEKINTILLKDNTMTKSEIEDFLNQIYIMYNFDIDDVIIKTKIYDGYIEPQKVNLEIVLPNGEKKYINYPREEYIVDFILESGNYSYTIKNIDNNKSVVKSKNVEVKEMIPHPEIFQFTPDGTITGIKNEYIEEINMLYSTYQVYRPKKLKCGAPYLVIPSEIEGTKITKIGKYAFSEIVNIVRVSIPNSVIEIEKDAFSWSSNIREVQIPNSVKIIGEDAFFHCEALTKINIPRSVTDIRDGAFLYIGFRNLYIPNSVKNIGKSAIFSVISNAEINCEIAQKPIGWNNKWNYHGIDDVQCKANWNVPFE